MLHLKKGRQFQIPNGFKFKLALGPNKFWEPPPFSSFDQVVAGAKAVILNNRALAAKNHWPTDSHVIADWVEDYNAHLCAANGWTDYYENPGGLGLPKRSAAQQRSLAKELVAAAAKVKQLAAGYVAIRQWKVSGDPAVPAAQSAARAAICAACPQNQAGDWTAWFTKPAADMIQRDLEKLQERQLSTPSDPALKFCQACSCPMRLKVHVPVEFIRPTVTPEIAFELKKGRDCWVLSELG